MQYSRMAVRTRFVDDHIIEFLHSQPGKKQVVLLGAGMDSRAWRMSLPKGNHRSSLTFMPLALLCAPCPCSSLATLDCSMPEPITHFQCKSLRSVHTNNNTIKQ